MRVLITGGAGMIGSHLAAAAIAADHDVTVVDDFSRGNERVLDELPQDSFGLIRGDLRDYSVARSACAGQDVVFHLADMVSGIDFVFDNEYEIFRNNVTINSNVLSAAIDHNVGQFLYAGTACSYPKEKQSSIGGDALTEEDVYPANPESSYGWSKLIGEYEIGLADKEKKIKSLVLRFHNVYGPHCDVHPKTSQVIPALCVKAANRPSELSVWGSGNQRRAFLFVEDAVSALMLGLEKGMESDVIQIGPSESTSIRDLALKIRDISGVGFEIVFDES